eukprot:SAG31_NODE_2650_length_5298_cov_1.690710_6_plen_157_part_00
MTNYDMAKPPGRTYKYYTGKATWPYGWGLSYTTFDMGCASQPAASGAALVVECAVKNTGRRLGDEVVLVFHRVGDAIRTSAAKLHPVPFKSLVDFERVTVDSGETKTIHFQQFESSKFELIDAMGNKTLYPGAHSLVFSRGHGNEATINVTLPFAK